jgi:membrane protein involved in colicin uptake
MASSSKSPMTREQLDAAERQERFLVDDRSSSDDEVTAGDRMEELELSQAKLRSHNDMLLGENDNLHDMIGAQYGALSELEAKAEAEAARAEALAQRAAAEAAAKEQLKAKAEAAEAKAATLKAENERLRQAKAEAEAPPAAVAAAKPVPLADRELLNSPAEDAAVAALREAMLQGGLPTLKRAIKVGSALSSY